VTGGGLDLVDISSRQDIPVPQPPAASAVQPDSTTSATSVYSTEQRSQNDALAGISSAVLNNPTCRTNLCSPPDAPDSGTIEAPLQRFYQEYFTSFMVALLQV
jgi:hypothetical protein